MLGVIAGYIEWSEVLKWVYAFMLFYPPPIILCLLVEKLWFSQYLFGKVWSAKKGLDPTQTWSNTRTISSKITSKIILLSFYYLGLIYYWKDWDLNFLYLNFAIWASYCFGAFILSKAKGKPFVVFMIEAGCLSVYLLIFNITLIVLFFILMSLPH
jgi:hypothetical protein